MNKKVYIDGMSCGHCVKHVEEALSELIGVNSVKVSLENKVADVDMSENVEDQIIRAAIQDAGYQVTKIV